MDARLAIGANGGPDLDPFDALKVNADDLLDQVRSIGPVTNDDQLQAVETLMGELCDALDAMEAERVRRKKPHDDAINAIQDQFNPYIAPLKNKAPGKLSVAQDVLKKARTPYLVKLEQDRLAAVAEAKRIADEKAAAALEALRAAEPADMEAREEAEALVSQAAVAVKQAAKAETTATKGNGLRSYWTPTLDNAKAALTHYVTTRPDDVRAFLLSMAERDVKAGARSVPGFIVTEERR